MTTDTTTDIEWGFNCLTNGIHHGRPEAIWNIALLHATNIFQVNVLEELVVTRIYTDALQFVEASPPGHVTTQEWAEKVKKIAQDMFSDVLGRKIAELKEYYGSINWQREQEDAARRFKEGKLNPHYAPLHSHDSINMLCRIIGSSASRQAAS